MPEGVIVLTEWTSMSGFGGFMLFVGLVCFVLFSLTAILCKEDLGNNWFCVVVIVSVIGLSMLIGSLFVPKDHGYMITLTDDAEFSEIVKHYEIISVDNLILKVKERK